MAQLKKREKILAMAAGGFLVAFLATQFFSGKPEPPAKNVATAPSTKEKGKPGTAQEAAPKAGAEARPAESGTPVKFANWGRDPFALAFRLQEQDTTGIAASDFTLRGIIWSGNEARALIGDEILKNGESTGDLTVVSIGKDRVKCRKGRELVTLVLNEDDE